MADWKFTEIELNDCPRCGGTDLDRGEHDGTPLIGCTDCGWPDLPRQEISIGQAWDEAHARVYQLRCADVACDCGLDGKTCDGGCECACHFAPVH